MAAHGTTTVEAKSGYGLTVESELKSLEAIEKPPPAGRERSSLPCSAPTSCPKEFQGRSQKYVEIVCKEMIPAGGQAEARPVRRCLLRQRRIYARRRRNRSSPPPWRTGLSVRAHMGQLSETRLSPFLRFQSGFVRSHGPRERRRHPAACRAAIPWLRWCREQIIFWA